MCGDQLMHDVSKILHLEQIPRTIPPALEIEIIEIGKNNKCGYAIWHINEEGLEHLMRCIWYLNAPVEFDRYKINLIFRIQNSSSQEKFSKVLFNAPPFGEQSTKGLHDEKLHTELIHQFERPRHDKRRRCLALFIHDFNSKGGVAYAKGDFDLASQYYSELWGFITDGKRHWNSGESPRTAREGLAKLCKASVRTKKSSQAIRDTKFFEEWVAQPYPRRKHRKMPKLSKLQRAKLRLCTARAWFHGEADASKGISAFSEAQSILGEPGQLGQRTRTEHVRDFVKFAYESTDGCEEWTKLITDGYAGLSLEDEDDDCGSEVVSETTTSDSDYYEWFHI
ncbi:hypothetical protein MMC18_006360 [Xylographa bjoerkii]|nr:hypothetical protein [Xylographa bjoerkii]